MFREGRPVSEHGRGFGKVKTQETERVTKLKTRLYPLPFASVALLMGHSSDQPGPTCPLRCHMFFSVDPYKQHVDRHTYALPVSQK